MGWFGLALCNINHSGNLIPILFTHILNIYDFCLVGFHGLSTIVSYLMPNAFYTYISNIYFGFGLALWHIKHCGLVSLFNGI